MQSTELEEALTACVTEVLETMFFTWPSAEGVDQTYTPDEDWVSARLRFCGAPSGTLEVSVSPDAARSMAASFLGVEESELAAAQVGEVVCEAANMICGSLLSRVEGEYSFNLMHPELVQAPGIAARKREGSAPAICLRVPLESGGLVVLVELETDSNERPCQDKSPDR